MTRTKRFSTPIALAALALLVTVPLLAAPGQGGDRAGGPGEGADLAAFLPPPGYLDLTDEQKDATRAILQDLRDQLAPLRDEGATLREALAAAVDAGDAAAAGDAVIALAGLKDEARTAVEAARTAFEDILDAEQLVKWENFQELRRLQRRRWGRGAGGDGGDDAGGFRLGDFARRRG